MQACISLFIFVSFPLPHIKQVNTSCNTVDLYSEGALLSFSLGSIDFPQQTLHKYQDNTLNKAKTAFIHFFAIHYLFIILQFNVKNFLRTDSVIK